MDKFKNFDFFDMGPAEPDTPAEALTLLFRGEPKAVQSFRFTKQGRRYQPGDTVDWKNYIRLSAQEQLPESFRMFSGVALLLDADFVFTAPGGMSKTLYRRMEAGGTIFKRTRPDLTDNLMKGLCDALTGIVWKDDGLISQVHSRKIYGPEPMTRLKILALK